MTLEVLCLLEPAVTDGTLSKDHDRAFKSARHHRAQAMMLLPGRTENLGVSESRERCDIWVTVERGERWLVSPAGVKPIAEKMDDAHFFRAFSLATALRIARSTEDVPP